MLAGGEPNQFRNVARFHFAGPLLRGGLRDRQRLPRAGAQRAALSTNHAARPSGVPDANPRAAARYSPEWRIQYTSGTPRPCGSSPLAIVTNRDTPRATTPVGGAERRQRQQLSVGDGGQHRRGHVGFAGHDVDQQLQPRPDAPRRPAGARAGRRRRGPRRPARAAAPMPASGPSARRRRASSHRPPAPPTPEVHRPAADRARRFRATAARRPRAPRTPAPPAAPPPRRSPASPASSCGGGAPCRAPRGPLRPPRRRRAVRPAAPAGADITRGTLAAPSGPPRGAVQATSMQR